MSLAAWVALGVFLAFWWWLWHVNEKRETREAVERLHAGWRKQVWWEMEDALRRFPQDLEAEHPYSYKPACLDVVLKSDAPEDLKLVEDFKRDWLLANVDRIERAAEKRRQWLLELKDPKHRY